MQRNEAVAQLKRLREVLGRNTPNLNLRKEYVWFAEDTLREYSRYSRTVCVYYVEETTQGSGDYMIKKRWECL